MARRKSGAGSSRLGAALAVVGVLAAVLALDGGAVNAQLGPPQRDEPLAAVWLSVGEVREVDVSAAFSGLVDSYTASSDNESAVRISVAGPVVSLEAVTAGAAFVRVTATNDAGSATQWFGAVSAAVPADDGDALPIEDDEATTVEEDPVGTGAGDASRDGSATELVGGDDGSVPGGAPRRLAIILSSWAYCAVERPGDVRSYDDPDPVRHRGEVARFNVNYTVFGGRGPYVISSPHATSAKTDESGVLEMACANPDPAAEGPVYRVDLYNPIEVFAEVTDADGTTASATMTVGRAVATRYVRHGDGTVSVLLRVLDVENPENDYVVATPAAWTLVTLLPNVDLRFGALGSDGVAHFADAGGGSEVWVDWTTATVLESRIVVTGDTYSHRVPITPELEWEMSLMSAGWPWERRPSTDGGLMEDA